MWNWKIKEKNAAKVLLLVMIGSVFQLETTWTGQEFQMKSFLKNLEYAIQCNFQKLNMTEILFYQSTVQKILNI
jgi:hypothetical protein